MRTQRSLCQSRERRGQVIRPHAGSRLPRYPSYRSGRSSSKISAGNCMTGISQPAASHSSAGWRAPTDNHSLPCLKLPVALAISSCACMGSAPATFRTKSAAARPASVVTCVPWNEMNTFSSLLTR